LLSLGLAGTNASAQWYLFPGVKNKINTLLNPAATSDTLSTTSQTAIPAVIDSTDLETIPETGHIVKPEITKVTLALPFGQNENASSNMFDFYSGVLLALRDEGRSSGQKIEIDVFDLNDGTEIPYGELKNSNMIIGPVSESAVSSLESRIHGTHQYVISPLDPKVSALAATHQVIQVPSNWEHQTDNALQWLKDDCAPSDRIVFVKESGAEPTEYERHLFSKAAEMGLKYSVLQYNILQGLKIYPQFEAQATATGTTRFMIASETESFIGDAIRNIALLQHKEFDVAVYGPAKIRSFANLETENFYKLSLKLAVSYFIDYEDPKVKSFIYTYRALYRNEPNAFAFGGYDTATYFLKACSVLGTDWTETFQDFTMSGLQSDFDFDRSEFMTGFLNTAVRRIQYNPDYTINIVR